MILTHYSTIEAYRTKDASEIRELIHPDVHGNQGQSLAEAQIPPGGSTLLHKHRHSEEIYHFLSANGVMIVGKERFKVAAGDTVCIPADVPHKVTNNSEDTMKILCCCSPPYRHEDTTLLEDES